MIFYHEVGCFSIICGGSTTASSGGWLETQDLEPCLRLTEWSSPFTNISSTSLYTLLFENNCLTHTQLCLSLDCFCASDSDNCVLWSEIVTSSSFMLRAQQRLYPQQRLLSVHCWTKKSASPRKAVWEKWHECWLFVREVSFSLSHFCHCYGWILQTLIQ